MEEANSPVQKNESSVEHEAERSATSSRASSPRSPEPSRPLYELVKGSESQQKRAYSTAVKSRTILPPDTPMEERRELEQLKRSIVFDEAERDLEDGGDEAAAAAAEGEKSTEMEKGGEESESKGAPAPLSQHLNSGVGETDEGQEDMTAVLRQKLRQVEELLRKAVLLRQGMESIKDQGEEEFEEEQFAKVELMIQKLLQEKRSYEIMLAQISVVSQPESNEPQEKADSHLEALREQKRLLVKLVEQQKKLHDLEEKQALLVAMQRAAQSDLKRAEQRKAELREQMDNGEINAALPQVAEEQNHSVKSDDERVKKRLIELEAKQARLEQVLQSLAKKGFRKDEVIAGSSLQRQDLTDEAAEAQQKLAELDEASAQLAHLRHLLERMQELQGEADEASMAALRPEEGIKEIDGEEEEEEEEKESNNDDDDDIESLGGLLASGIEDPELKEQLMQLNERKRRIEALQKEIAERENENEDEEEEEEVEDVTREDEEVEDVTREDEEDDEEDDYTHMANWTAKQSFDVRLQKLELAKAKIEELQSLVLQAQTESERVGQSELRRRQRKSGTGASADDFIDVDELVRVKQMIGDYSQKLSEKKKELDKLVWEHRALKEAEDVMGGMKDSRRGSDYKPTKGEMASNTLLWTELQKQEQLRKQLKQKKKEVAALQKMASKQEEALEYARLTSIPTKRTGRTSADVTLATWGGSTQQSLESFPLHSQDQSGSESGSEYQQLLKPRNSSEDAYSKPFGAHKRRGQRRLTNLNPVPKKRKKHRFDSEFATLKEEPESATPTASGTRFFASAWPSTRFPQLKKDSTVSTSQEHEATATTSSVNPPFQSTWASTRAAARGAAENQPPPGTAPNQAKARHLHQQLLRSTTSCNSLLREQLALLQLIQGGERDPWRVQEYVRRLHESCRRFSQQQQEVMQMQGELSQLYDATIQNRPEAASLPSPFLSAYTPFAFPPPPPPFYAPWQYYPYAPHFFFGGSAQQYPTPPGMGALYAQTELPSTTRTVYPTVGGEEDDDVSSRKTYSVTGSNPGVNRLVVSHEGPPVAEHKDEEDDEESKGDVDVAAGLLERLSLSSGQSSVPGGGDEDEATGLQLFEALRDSIYSEVAALISQNESRPHFLIELFRELQLLSSDYLRQRALYAIQDLVTRYLTEDTAKAMSSTAAGGEIPESYFQGLVPSGSSQVSSNDDGGDESALTKEELAKYRKKYNAVLARAAAGSLMPGAYDYTEQVESASSLATPPGEEENPFAKDSLGETMIHYEKPKEKGVVSAQFEMTEDDGVSIDSDLEIDTQALDQQVKSIIHEVIPVLKDHMNETCSPQLLSFIQAFVLTLAQEKDDKEAFVRSFNSQLASKIQSALNKFVGKEMSECGEDLVVEISEILFNDLAFLKLMQQVRSPPLAIPKTLTQVQAVGSDSESSAPGGATVSRKEDDGNDDFTFDGNGEVAQENSEQGVLSNGQLDDEQEKSRDDTAVQQCESEKQSDNAGSGETNQGKTTNEKPAETGEEGADASVALTEMAAKKIEEIQQTVREEQGSLEGVNAVIKEVESQPELVGGNEPPSVGAAATAAAAVAEAE